jgi:hypothetical protein
MSVVDGQCRGVSQGLHRQMEMDTYHKWPSQQKNKTRKKVVGQGMPSLKARQIITILDAHWVIKFLNSVIIQVTTTNSLDQA